MTTNEEMDRIQELDRLFLQAESSGTPEDKKVYEDTLSSFRRDTLDKFWAPAERSSKKKSLPVDPEAEALQSVLDRLDGPVQFEDWILEVMKDVSPQARVEEATLGKFNVFLGEGFPIATVYGPSSGFLDLYVNEYPRSNQAVALRRLASAVQHFFSAAS